MTTVITEPTDIFHTFTDEQKTKAYSEWRQVEADLREYMVETMEYDGYTVKDPKSLAWDHPEALRMWLIEAGEQYVTNVYLSDLLTSFLAYDQHKAYMDSPYSTLIEEAETVEEREDWTARTVLWEESLWDVADEILADYANALESLGTDLAEECRKAWYLG